MAACPNANACQGDRDALLTCQSAAYMSPATSGELQVNILCLVSAVSQVQSPTPDVMYVFV